MKPIVQIKFGSHLYGTSTSSSDLDIKGLYIPTAKDILLQRVQPIVSYKRAKAHGEKNTPEDVDCEFYSPERYLMWLAQGQTMALDMLFAPDSAMITPPGEEWLQIKSLAPNLLTKQSGSFARYCRQQANKYGIKGSRVAAARLALEFLSEAEAKNGPTTKLLAVQDGLKSLSLTNEFLFIGKDVEGNGNEVMYFEICGKKALFNASIKSARSIAQRLKDEYGERALTAERNEGIDWKALSHAVRVGREAIEFLTTQHITFPRPEAKHLLDIKQGRLSFHQVSEEIEQLLVEVEAASAASSLPDHFDQTLIDNFIEKLHLKSVLKEAE